MLQAAVLPSLGQHHIVSQQVEMVQIVLHYASSAGTVAPQAQVVQVVIWQGLDSACSGDQLPKVSVPQKQEQLGFWTALSLPAT